MSHGPRPKTKKAGIAAGLFCNFEPRSARSDQPLVTIFAGTDGAS